MTDKGLSSAIEAFFRPETGGRSPSQNLAAAEAVQEAVAAELAARLRDTLNDYLSGPVVQDSNAKSFLVDAFNAQLSKLRLSISHPVTGKPSALVVNSGKDSILKFGVVELGDDGQNNVTLEDSDLKNLQYIPARDFPDFQLTSSPTLSDRLRGRTRAFLGASR